jgi:type IV secretory pathway VirB3-like protein
MKSDTFFKAFTRPAMVMGVPIVPFVLNGMFGMTLIVYIHFFLFPVLIISHFILRKLGKQDELIFETYFLHLRTKMMTLGNTKTADNSIFLSQAKMQERK